MRRCLILTDGGPKYGSGHLKRSAALATLLEKRGVTTSVIPQPLEKSTESIFTDKPDLLVLDLPYWNLDTILLDARLKGIATLGLDYFGKEAPDLVISAIEHFEPIPAGKRLSGLAYAMIRSDFWSCPKGFDSKSTAIVMIGGADIKHERYEAANAALKYHKYVTVIEGQLTTPELSSTETPYKILRNPPDLVRHMTKAAFAITNGGSSMLEMMFLGIPCVVLPQTQFEQNLAAHVVKSGGILGIGLDALTLTRDSKKLESVSKTSQSIVDGKGLDRIIDEALKLIATRS